MRFVRLDQIKHMDEKAIKFIRKTEGAGKKPPRPKRIKKEDGMKEEVEKEAT